MSKPFTECDTKLEEYQTLFTDLRTQLATLVTIDGATTIGRVETELGKPIGIPIYSVD